MLVTVFAFVACNKKAEPETKWETPTALMGTEWVYGEGTTFSYTLIFETGNTGVKKCHNDLRAAGGEVYDTQRDIKSYTYANGKGEYKDDKNDTFEFTIDGGTLTEYDPLMEDYLAYKRKKIRTALISVVNSKSGQNDVFLFILARFLY